jgi:coenzyme F420-reducing hydrogenase delta subunit
MKTSVEWLESCLTEQYQNGSFVWNTKADLKALFRQAKEMENHQLECAWYSSNENMRFQFSSSAYKAITFKQWLENFKKE